MPAQVPPYPNALRACIKQAGYSFREVSKETAIPESTLYDWAAGNRPIPHLDRDILATLLGCPVEALAPVGRTHLAGNPTRESEIQYPYGQLFIAFGRDIMNRLRRSLLRYAPAMTSVAMLAPLGMLDSQDHERVSQVIAEPSRVDKSALGAFEDISSTYWQMYRNRTLASGNLMFEYALAHLFQVVHVGSASLPTTYQQRLCEITADAAHLVGYIAWDLNYRDITDEVYTLALQAAAESGTPTAHALVLGDMTFAALFSGKPHEALPLITQAKQLVTAETTPMLLRAWIASVAAEIEAALHDETSGLWDSTALRDLEIAEQCVSTSRLDENDTSSLRTGFDVARLAGYQGTCYLYLHRAEEAREVFTRSLALLSPTRMSSKAIDLTKLAESFRQLGNVGAACSVATEALNIEQHIRSGYVLQQVQSLRRQFAPEAITQAVRDLDDHLALFQTK